MDIEKLQKRLASDAADWAGDGYIKRDLHEATDALEKLQAELDRYRSHHKRLSALPDCNTCNSKDCTYRPNIGAFTRINCPLWRGQKED